MDIKSRIEYLRHTIESANIQYHTYDTPLISDFQYDTYMKELIELEQSHPEYHDPHSPTQKIGGGILSQFHKVTHQTPMMSLSNVFNLDELQTFVERIQKESHSQYVTELKIDGLAVSIQYEKGIFKRAATRGNGLVGEDITENVKTIKNLPLKLKEPIDIEVRGEIYMPLKSFEDLNASRSKQGEALFANPRNAAAGTMRQLDSKVVASRNLAIFVYAIVNQDTYVKTQEALLTYLTQLGLPVNPHFKVHTSPQSLYQSIETYDTLRHTLPYDTDGVVIKVNEFSVQSELGYTVKYPKFAVAYKFQAEIGETLLKSITFQVGRTGVITPVAELEPVFISGTQVSRATLHNEDYIRLKDIRVGDYVRVHKAGEIIPEVMDVIISQRQHQQPFEMITTCPVCQQKLERQDGEADYFCLNPQCDAKQMLSIIHFASRVAMDIDTLGEKVVETLYQEGFLNTIPDIYTLNNHIDRMKTLPGFGDKKVDKLISAIEASKQQPFDKVLFGLGIKHVGAKVAKLLTKQFDSMDALLHTDLETLTNIADIGEEIAKSILKLQSDDAFIKTIEQLKQHGLKLTATKETIISHPFNNKTFVLTGKLETYSREDAQKLIEQRGGKVSSSVSSKTDYVLAGSEAGSKLDKATAIGITILTEDTFKDMI